jgi:hypothetical protein
MKGIIILMMTLSSSVFQAMGQKSGDDTMAWNGIWNQDDPKCPCYKIQKQAETEYMDILRKESKYSIEVEGENESVLSKTKQQRKREDRRRKKKKYTGKPVCPIL